ncbi:hypothetical protein RB598_002242 [Gaeumannomyces tritici]
MATSQEKSISLTTAGPRRAVLLVTCPVDQMANAFLAYFGAKIERKTPPISTWKPGAYPRVADNLSFSRHMAICLVPMEVWEDDDMSFRDKLEAGRFWDHRGKLSGLKHSGSGRNGNGLDWERRHVESIEAVELLGTTDEWDFTITGLYGRLHHGWVYRPCWWNCQDFAIRLAYVIQPTADVSRLLLRMACDLKEEIMQRVFRKRDKVLGWYGGLGLLIRASAHRLDGEMLKLCETYMRGLEGRLPSLESFHADLKRETSEKFSVEVAKREWALLLYSAQ